MKGFSYGKSYWILGCSYKRTKGYGTIGNREYYYQKILIEKSIKKE
ncbi:MAG: hypothetical protein N4A64_07395 [Marinisporobacter sp.]|jgi:hypothetical protein|nr:hypothetical protein [Marinisporobacter sp.]